MTCNGEVIFNYNFTSPWFFDRDVFVLVKEKNLLSSIWKLLVDYRVGIALLEVGRDVKNIWTFDQARFIAFLKTSLSNNKC